jgi:hypothetical protein
MSRPGLFCNAHPWLSWRLNGCSFAYPATPRACLSQLALRTVQATTPPTNLQCRALPLQASCAS